MRFLSLTYIGLISTKSLHVVECPEFRDLCLLLRPSLQAKEIPLRGKLREGIMEYWHGWFHNLKRDLAVRTVSALLLLCNSFKIGLTRSYQPYS